MKKQSRWIASILTSLTAVLALSAAGPAAAQTERPRRVAPRRAAAPDDTWPKTVRMGETMTISLDAPLAESMKGTKLIARGTLRIQRQGGADPISGTARYEAEVQIDRDRRMVTLTTVEVSEIELARTPAPMRQRMATRIGMALARMQVRLPLDDVLAAAKLSVRKDEAPPKLNTDPPKILFETQPAILITFDGEPRFRTVEGSHLERALNTPFLVLHDVGENAYYLNGGTMWFRSSAPKGPWTKTEGAPPEAIKIARGDLHEAGVADSDVEQAKQSAEKRIPKILVTTEPVELIVSDGPPRWSPVVAGEIETIDNSESNVFRTPSDQQYWVVLSGRWFKSDSYSGPWTYVQPDRIPESFRKIPSDSPKAEVLAFVPGTGAAREALADANKPRTTEVRRSEAHVSVTYDGDPRFEAIPGTRVEYALNTPDQVLRIRGRCYVCDKGIWFTAAQPSGPWLVSDSIPDEEIQTIPPESPVYNTRFAYVYDATPEVVYEAYTPAYVGSYPYYGTVVFGTGWFYRPWAGAFYYPRPWTWGFHARYAPWAGWGFGFGWGPAWGGFRYGFGFGWGARWCGPGAFFRPAFRNVNVNVNVTRSVTVNRNLYNSGANQARTAGTAGTQRAAAKTQGGARQAAAKNGGAGHAKTESPKGGRARGAAGRSGGKRH